MSETPGMTLRRLAKAAFNSEGLNFSAKVHQKGILVLQATRWQDPLSYREAQQVVDAEWEAAGLP